MLKMFIFYLKYSLLDRVFIHREKNLKIDIKKIYIYEDDLKP